MESYIIYATKKYVKKLKLLLHIKINHSCFVIFIIYAFLITSKIIKNQFYMCFQSTYVDVFKIIELHSSCVIGCIQPYVCLSIIEWYAVSSQAYTRKFKSTQKKLSLNVSNTYFNLEKFCVLSLGTYINLSVVVLSL